VGPVASVVWAEGTCPLVVVRSHLSLGYVKDAWLVDGIDFYHVRAYVPHSEWRETYLREFLLYQFTFVSDPSWGLPLSVDRFLLTALSCHKQGHVWLL
jgi:hypothetical protein